MKTFITIILLSVAALAAPTEFTRIPTVKLAWDSTDEHIAGYRVHLGAEPGQYTMIIDVGMAELSDDGNSRVSGPVELPQGGKWFCAVTAYNSYGLESDYSNEISFERKVPTAPGNLKLDITIETSSNLEDWQPVAKITEDMDQRKFYRLSLTPTN